WVRVSKNRAIQAESGGAELNFSWECREEAFGRFQQLQGREVNLSQKISGRERAECNSCYR
ncbi:hypothetical protein KI387_026228, partial [Taxus chinensis]